MNHGITIVVRTQSSVEVSFISPDKYLIDERHEYPRMLKAINLRNTNERQEGMNYGAVPMVHFNIERIENLIQYFENKRSETDTIKDYVSPNFSKIFYNILISYIDYVNQNTWKK